MCQVKELVLKTEELLSLKLLTLGNIFGSVQHIFKESKYVQISINLVPSKHGTERVSCQDMLGLPKKTSKDLEIFSEVITRNETSVCGCK